MKPIEAKETQNKTSFPFHKTKELPDVQRYGLIPNHTDRRYSPYGK